jgi:NAD(P)H-flavin reductase
VPESEFIFRTGEFIELTINGYGEAPFTPSSSPLIKDMLQVTVMRAGYVTEKIHALMPGDVVGIRGPFGGAVIDFTAKKCL